MNLSCELLLSPQFELMQHLSETAKFGFVNPPKWNARTKILVAVKPAVDANVRGSREGGRSGVDLADAKMATTRSLPKRRSG